MTGVDSGELENRVLTNVSKCPKWQASILRGGPNDVKIWIDKLNQNQEY